MLLDNLCQAYHWTLDEAMRLTVPQILMLSHAAKVNYDRLQERVERDKVADKEKKELDRKDPVMANGKRMSDCTMDELMPQIGSV